MHFDEKSMFAGDKKGAKSLKVKSSGLGDRVWEVHWLCFNPVRLHCPSPALLVGAGLSGFPVNDTTALPPPRFLLGSFLVPPTAWRALSHRCDQ